MLDTTFAALSDPTRRGIIEVLAGGEHAVGELVNRFSLSASTITRHLDTLENAGLISRLRDSQRRICRLEGGALQEVDRWLADYRKFWSGALRRLDVSIRKTRK